MKFSIITINYNNKDGLRNTIESVINQTFTNFEYIIIDGGSTDGSVDVIKEYADRIDYWVSEPDKGIYNAMNKGIKQAHGKYLNFMNSGDCFFNELCLEYINKCNDKSDLLIGKDYYYDKISNKSFMTILPPILDMFIFYKHTLPHQSTFFKKDLFKSYLYDEEFHYVSDWKFYIQKLVFEKCSYMYYNGPVCKRDEKNGISYTHNDAVLAERDKYLKEILPHGINIDYNIISNIDRSTFYKILSICKHPKSLFFLTYAVKIIYRILAPNKQS